MAARPEAPRAGVRPAVATARARRAGLAWRRLPAAAELATIGAGYAAYSLVRLAIRAGRQAAFAHAAELWQAERRLHVTAEPYLDHLAAAHTCPPCPPGIPVRPRTCATGRNGRWAVDGR